MTRVWYSGLDGHLKGITGGQNVRPHFPSPYSVGKHGVFSVSRTSTKRFRGKVLWLNLLSVAHKNTSDSRRAAWRTTTSVEQKEKTKGNKQQATYASECAVKEEAQLQNISDGILALMDKDLIPLESTGEPNVFYYMMKSNFYRYLAECVTGDTQGKVAEDACVGHAGATKVQKTVEVPQVQ